MRIEWRVSETVQGATFKFEDIAELVDEARLVNDGYECAVDCIVDVRQRTGGESMTTTVTVVTRVGD